MKKVAELAPQEREALERVYREGASHRQRQRAQALMLSSRGFCIEALAEIFGIDRDTISAWLERWRNRQADESIDSVLSDAPKSGRPSKLLQSEKQELLALAHQGRPNLKAEALAELKKKGSRPVGTP
jgi:transposase